jgi:hypothetical protein
MRIPRHQRAVFLRADFDLSVGGGPRPGGFHFHVAIEHQLDGLARGLRQLRHVNAPFVGRELAAKSSPDVIANGLDIVVRNVSPLLAQCLSDLARKAGNILGGGISEKFSPVHSATLPWASRQQWVMAAMP